MCIDALFRLDSDSESTRNSDSEQFDSGDSESEPDTQAGSVGEPAKGVWGLPAPESRCPRLIKIDAERMDVDVLLGSVATVQRCRPVLHLESDRDIQAATAMVSLLASWNYTSRWEVSPYTSIAG